jgi:hypothetical protein
LSRTLKFISGITIRSSPIHHPCIYLLFPSA